MRGARRDPRRRGGGRALPPHQALGGLSSEAIRYCLDEAGATLADVAHVAVNSNPKANFLRKIGYARARRPDPGLDPRSRAQSSQAAVDRGGADRGLSRCRIQQPGASRRAPLGAFGVVLSCLAVRGGGRSLRSTASATSRGAAWGTGRGTTIDVEGRIYFPHSLGIFYQALTQYHRLPALRRRVQSHGAGALWHSKILARDAQDRAALGWRRLRARHAFFRHHKEKIAYEWRAAAPMSAPSTRRLSRNCWAPLDRKTSPFPTVIAISPARCRPCTRRLSSISSTRSMRATSSTV